MAKYSLDPENRKAYGRKEEEWRAVAREKSPVAVQTIEDAQEKTKPVAKGAGSGIIRLPRYQEVSIPRAKFTEYALNPLKDANKAEAFKKALGYTLENADDLIEQINAKLSEYNAVEKGDRGWGATYEVVMDITGPNGKTAKVLTAWIDDKNSGEMRLTTIHVDK